MKKISTKKNFENLVSALKKCLLDNLYAEDLRKTYFSKKHNAYISERTPYLFLMGPSSQYFLLANQYRNDEITREIFELKLKELNNKYSNIYRKTGHKLKLFVYLENDRFCADISDNDVRTKLLEIELPEKISCDHNNSIIIRFENTIKKQLGQYINQFHSNIQVIYALL